MGKEGGKVVDRLNALYSLTKGDVNLSAKRDWCGCGEEEKGVI